MAPRKKKKLKLKKLKLKIMKGIKKELNEIFLLQKMNKIMKNKLKTELKVQNKVKKE